MANIKLANKYTAITPNQVDFVRATVENDIIFLSGPSGSGKTHSSIGMACSNLSRNKVDKLVITRPIVNCGSGLGFLPGDLGEKFYPYLAPVMSKLKHFLGEEQLGYLIGMKVIEFMPLEVMRGESLKDSFIVVDEVSNCTVEQIKMLITRLDLGSTIVAQGDMQQCDLQYNDLEWVHERWANINIEGFEWVYFTDEDNQRPKLINKLTKALYD